MTEYIFVFVFLTACSFAYLAIAKRFRIVDKPNHRSSHTKPTIRGGGIVFLFGLLTYFVMSGFSYPYFVLGTMLIAVVSFTDDLKTLSARIRWPFQVISILLIFYEIGFDYFPVWTYLPVLVLAVGFINFFNFMDGINGITGLSALVTMGAFYYLNIHYLVVDESLLICILISVVIFGYFNFRKKALMFAGDIGSITLGMIILYVGVKLILVIQSPLIVVLYMVYGADSTLTIFYRIYNKEKISDPHRHHMYQKLVDNFCFSHLYVSGLYAVLQIILNVITLYFILNVEIQYHFLIGFAISLVLTFLYIYLFRKNEKQKKN